MTASSPAADFGSRFSAFIIDAAILFVAQWVAVIVLARQLQAVGLTSLTSCENDATRQCEGPSSALWTLLVLLLLASTVGYHAFFEGRHGATPGKRWMGLRVVSATNGGPIGMAAAGLRSVVRQGFWLSLFFVFDASPLGLSLPPFLFIAVPLVALAIVAWAAFAADGRGVHDIAAGTVVVRDDSLPSQTAASDSAHNPDTTGSPTPAAGADDLTESNGDDDLVEPHSGDDPAESNDDDHVAEPDGDDHVTATNAEESV